MITKIRKRDGRYVKFNENKITEAIQKAILAVEAEVTLNKIYKMTKEVVKIVNEETPEGRIPTVENIQDIVERVLMNSKLTEVAKAYILYREERSKVREKETKLMKTFQAIEQGKKTTSKFLLKKGDFHFENPTKAILFYGREGAKEYNKIFTIDKEYVKMHEDGDIFIKEIEYYTSSFNTFQINSSKVVENGIIIGDTEIGNCNTIEGFLKTLLYVISKTEEEIYGGIQISDFDFLISKAVMKNHEKMLISNLNKLALFNNIKLKTSNNYEEIIEELIKSGVSNYLIEEAKNITKKELEEELFKAFKKFLLDIKMMPTKNQSGVINLSIAYGTDESEYGRLVIKNILLATKEHIYTSPVQIFKIKEGINFNKKDKNYDLFKLAIETHALTMYPNFMFLDSKANNIEGINNLKDLTYGANRSRIITKSPLGRGSLGETIINLPRVALNSNSIETFYENLEVVFEKVIDQLLEKYNYLSNLKAYHLPFLMIGKTWCGSETLNIDDNIKEVIKNGSLDIGFIGLAETLQVLVGTHHGKSSEAYQLGIEIISFLNKLIEEKIEKYELNFQLIASSKVDLLENFVLKDQQKYGIIKNVTDKSFYTDSFHIPSDYPINAELKIEIEAPYHNLIKGGHITYIELGGEQKNKESSILGLLKLMKKKEIGYAAINHHLDIDPLCGFIGKITDEKCPKCKRLESLEKPFLKYRRINDLLITPINLEVFEHEEVDLRVTHLNNLMRVSGFVNDSIVDGPGLRFVIFAQGCLLECPGCHNVETWDLEGGRLVELDDICKMWKKNPLLEGITISGGDPFLQPDKTLYLDNYTKEDNLSVVVYSGEYYEDLLKKENPIINQILELSDLLIDGPFEIDKLNLNLLYRGSENQRIIDLVKTNKSGKLKLFS